MTYKEWFKQVKKDNATFKKANKARRRVMVAKDVIKGLEANLFRASGHSGYMDFTGDDQSYNHDDFRDFLVNDNPACNVCAKGAIFTCVVMRQDNVSTDDYQNCTFSSHSLSNLLDGLFSEDQLSLIEDHYEVGRFGHGPELGGTISPFAKYHAGATRMIAIMKNIIRNGGEFKPDLED